MMKLAFLTLVGAALFATTGAASAQYGPAPPGPGVYIEPRYDRDYDRPRYRRDREERRYYRRGNSGGGGGGCPYGYTVQDGVCKPYTGR
jgi:hypothetical protein